MMYTIRFDQPQQSPNQQGPVGMPVQIDEETRKKMIEAELRHLKSIVRNNDINMLMSGLQEIRLALNFPSVSDNDNGNGERPAMKPIFSEDNQAKLQNAYLNLYMRYGKYIDHVLQEDGVSLPSKDIDPKP